MHRLIRSTLASAVAVGTLAFTLGCGGSKKPAATAGSETPAEEAPSSASEHSSSSSRDSGGEPAEKEKKDECLGFEFANLEEALLKSACEEPGVKPDSVQPVDVKDKLQVTLSASPSKVSPGGKADLLVTYANKSKDPLILHFRIDPVPRFEVEVYDTSKKPKRADLPHGPTPARPKGATTAPLSEPKAARVTIAPNGTARARIPWDAVRTRWAPEKVRGTPPERGYPRVPAGPLPKGKYTVKVVTPLVGVSEGPDHELTAPKLDLEVGG